MFCNKCGRTIKGDEAVCQKCGAPLGDSRFEGSGYTSVQPRYMPSEPESADSPYTPYTRTTYTTMDQPEKEDVLTRTTYRPVLAEDKKVEEEIPDAQKSAPVVSETPAEPLKIEIEPLKPIVMKGINPEVEDYIKRIKSRGAAPLLARKKRAHTDDDEQEGETTKIDLGDEDDDEDDFTPSGGFVGRIIGLAAGSIVILGLLVFGFFRLSSSLAPKSPIEGVSKSVYDEGITLIQSRKGSDYRTEITGMFEEYNAGTATEGNTVYDRLEADKNQISALLPEKPQENDQAFVDALLAIQESIAEAISYDSIVYMMRNTESSALMEEKSVEAWNTVLEAIQRITDATDPLELSQIAQTQIDTSIPEQPVVTTSPTPAPYRTLTKGAKNDEVKKLQQRLIELNYMTGQADGEFGSVTQTAVKKFQQAIGMQNQDGIATPELQEALFGDNAPLYSPAQTSNTGQ